MAAKYPIGAPLLLGAGDDGSHRLAHLVEPGGVRHAWLSARAEWQARRRAEAAGVGSWSPSSCPSRCWSSAPEDPTVTRWISPSSTSGPRSVGRIRESRSARPDGAGHLVGQATRAVEHDDGSPLPKVLHELGHGRRLPRRRGASRRDGRPRRRTPAERARASRRPTFPGSARSRRGRERARRCRGRPTQPRQPPREPGATPTTAAGRSGADDSARPSRWNTPASVPPVTITAPASAAAATAPFSCRRISRAASPSMGSVVPPIASTARGSIEGASTGPEAVEVRCIRSRRQPLHVRPEIRGRHGADASPGPAGPTFVACLPDPSGLPSTIVPPLTLVHRRHLSTADGGGHACRCRPRWSPATTAPCRVEASPDGPRRAPRWRRGRSRRCR